MSRVVKELDEAERQQMEAQADRIAETPHPQVDVHSGREFVFLAHFDGTLNNKNKLENGEFQTNIANLYELMKPYSKDHEGSKEHNENFVSHYEPGVGTQNSKLVGGLKASVSPSGDMRRTAEKVYQQFRHDVSDWLRNHPEADPVASVKVMASGFSRGGVTMAMFSQMLYENGLVDDEKGEILIPPGTLGLSGGIVYDPVSKGYKDNAAFSPTSRNITEVQATAEYRRWFKDVDHDTNPNVSTVEVMGNHSNIGGGYDQGISARVLEPSRQWFAHTGLPVDEIPEHMRYRADEPARIYEERDLPGMEQTRKFSGSHLVIGTAAALAGGGIIKPVEALLPFGVKWGAGKADYPRTHDPRDGLDAPRQQRPSARGSEQMADGWQQFEGVNGVVWSKDYGANQWDISRVVIVERNFPGRKNDRIDVYMMQGEGQLLKHQQESIAGGRKMRRRGAEIRQNADRDLSHPLDARLTQESLQTRDQKTDPQLQQKVEQRLEQRLEQQSNGNRQGIKAEGQNSAAPTSDAPSVSNLRQATSTQVRLEAGQRKQMAQAFKANPDAVLEQYPGDKRVNAARATLEAVSERHAGTARGDVWVMKMHNDLTSRLARGAAIPNPQQAFGMINRAMGRGGIGD